MGMILFLLGVLASIALHEVGHMVPAKKFGVKVTQYFVGFGKTVWSKQKGETEYGVKAIPMGGFIRMVGMLPPAAAEAAAETPGEATPGTSTRPEGEPATTPGAQHTLRDPAPEPGNVDPHDDSRTRNPGLA